MLLMIDNYDSFTYNLVHYFEQLGQNVVVRSNNQITIEEITAWKPDYIVLSPGPHTPAEAGITLDILKYFKGEIPILGICLGHQAIGQAFGAEVRRSTPVHGKRSYISHDQQGIFSGLPKTFEVTRYHSLSVDALTVPEDLLITAATEDGTIMGVRHKIMPIEGVQFHPESICTDYGYALLDNFLRLGKGCGPAPES